jgi:hypothetical protein
MFQFYLRDFISRVNSSVNINAFVFFLCNKLPDYIIS